MAITMAMMATVLMMQMTMPDNQGGDNDDDDDDETLATLTATMILFSFVMSDLFACRPGSVGVAANSLITRRVAQSTSS